MHPEVHLETALADNRLVDSADRDMIGHLRHLYRELQRYLARVVNAGEHVEIDADVEIRELGADKRAVCGCRRGIGVTAGCGRNLLADTERSFDVVEGPNLRR